MKKTTISLSEESSPTWEKKMTKTASKSEEYYSEICHCSKCATLREKEKKTKKIQAKEKK